MGRAFEYRKAATITTGIESASGAMPHAIAIDNAP